MRAALSAVLLALACQPAPAIRPDLSRIQDRQEWRLINAETAEESVDGRSALRLQPVGGNRKGSNVAIAAPEGVAFNTGTIEVDLRGNGEQVASFVGVAFNIVDATHYEAVYFRPFNFRAPDAEHKGHAVQYVAWPEHTWEALRRERPGRYEAEVAPVPDPARWFHARVEVGDAEVRVFVDGAEKPCLVVGRLAPQGAGAVGLMVDSREGWFAGLSVRPR